MIFSVIRKCGGWITVFTLIILFHLNSAGVTVRLCANTLLDLNPVPFDVLFQMEQTSNQRNFSVISKYKNDVPPERRPVTVNLFEIAPVIPQHLQTEIDTSLKLSAETWAALFAILEPYYQKIESLRKGDILLLEASKNHPRREIRLGEFLGAGDSAHIFALAEDAGRAIRIPYTRPLWRSLDWNFGTEGFVRTAPPENRVKRIKIFDHGPGYVLVERVYGDESSRAFLDRLRGSAYARPRLSEIHAALTAAEHFFEAAQLEKLIQTLILTNCLSEADGTSIVDARLQYTYDQKLLEWVMVDWEGE